MLVVKSKVKEYVKDCNVSGDFADALNNEIKALIEKAESRCKANGRKTVQARDL
jgi:histone H3/H4